MPQTTPEARGLGHLVAARTFFDSAGEGKRLSRLIGFHRIFLGCRSLLVCAAQCDFVLWECPAFLRLGLRLRRTSSRL
jgi:hypothetical protein